MASKKDRTAVRAGAAATHKRQPAAARSPTTSRRAGAVVAPAAPAVNPPMTSLRTRTNLVPLALLTLCGLILYFWRLDQPTRYVYDEVYHAYTASQLAAGNADAYVWDTLSPEADKGYGYEWTHPAFSKLAIQAGILLFGDTSFGWRFASAVFGGIGIGIIYLLGAVLFSRGIGLLAAGLMLFDGLWFVQSRTAMNDIFMVCFLLLAYLAFVFYLRSAGAERWRPLWLAGIALGFAMASKWSALPSFGLLGLIAGVRELRRYFTRAEDSPIPAALNLAGAFVVVPFTIYLGSYVQFFAMGHSLSDWRELQRQMWVYHSTLNATHTWQSAAWSWPLMITPVWYFVDYLPGETVANVFAMGNPVIWWAFLPAVVFVFVRWRESKYLSLGLGLVLLGFLGQWLPWFLSPRISFLYHMLPSVPFGGLAIAYTLAQLRSQRWLAGAYLVAVVIAFVYFFPQYSAWKVSRAYANQHYWLTTWQPR